MNSPCLSIFSYITPLQASVTVAISLYNYEHCIVNALDSVLAQSKQHIELIIVDDDSTDSSCATALSWLTQNHSAFVSVQLVQHLANSGLAATRNTAFRLACCDWVWVLDADNTLLPEALTQCTSIASSTLPSVGVVHPLIQIFPPPSASSPLQGNGVVWHRDHFIHSNTVDAMALVRRTAWAAVGGYSDIKDGWEDYDFWCKLIEIGWTGIVCPQILAIYNSHPNSMTCTSSLPSVRRLETTLQRRHPWLRCVGRTLQPH